VSTFPENRLDQSKTAHPGEKGLDVILKRNLIEENRGGGGKVSTKEEVQFGKERKGRRGKFGALLGGKKNEINSVFGRKRSGPIGQFRGAEGKGD